MKKKNRIGNGSLSELLLLVSCFPGYNRNERRRMVQQSESERERERALPPSLSSKMYLFIVVVASWDGWTHQCKYIDTARSANFFPFFLKNITVSWVSLRRKPNRILQLTNINL